MLKLTWNQAAAWRVRRHYLERRAAAGNMLKVASRICGLHAQLMSSAELTVWARVENLDRDTVRRALWEDRTLVKTWAMRGTLHLLPSSELPLWLGALGTSRRYLAPARWERVFGISIEQLDAFTEAVGKVLKGQTLTREELIAEAGRLAGPGAADSEHALNSWGTILRPAAFAGRLCFAPSVGQRVRFTHPETWLAAAGAEGGPAVDAQTATAAVARRFLSAYGPATYRDLGRWWGGGSGITTARQWIASLGEEAARVEVDGVEAWMLAGHIREARGNRPIRSVRLLPAFDPYVIGASGHAEQLLPDGLRGRVYRQQGWISPVLLVNGHMRGVWRHEVNGNGLDVTVEPFVKIPVWARRAAAGEAERLTAFLGCRLRKVAFHT